MFLPIIGARVLPTPRPSAKEQRRVRLSFSTVPRAQARLTNGVAKTKSRFWRAFRDRRERASHATTHISRPGTRKSSE